MQELKAKKKVIEELQKKIKTSKNSILSPKFAEKLQKSALNSQNEQITSKLQANKNIFARGDFDEYKISDEELEEHDIFNMNDEIEKGFGKYISKKFINGKWVYKYQQNRNIARSKINYCTSNKLPCSLNDALQKGEQFIKDWQNDWQLNRNKSRCPIFGGHTVVVVAIDSNGKEGISLQHFGYKGSGKKIPRSAPEIKQRAELLPFGKEMLESKDKCIINEVRTDGTMTNYEILGKAKINGVDEKICVIVSKLKNEGLTFLSIMKKAISEDIAFITDVFLLKEKSKHDSFWANPEGGVTLPQPITSITKSRNKSSNINKSLTYSGHKLQGRTKLYGMDISIENKNRPGFFGSMETLTIDQFKSFVFSKQGKRIHKSFDVTITDITENNKSEKIEQLQKSLNAILENKPFVIKHIPADRFSKQYDDITLRITDFDRNKVEKAVHKMALTLDGELKAQNSGEPFIFTSQEDLTNEIVNELTKKTNEVYQFVINYFNLPEIRIVSKALPLMHKGKIIYNPTTGEPIKRHEWKKFVEALEKFLNRNYSGIGEKIVLNSRKLGEILDRLLKTNSLEKVRKMKLAEVQKKADWISLTAKRMTDSNGNPLSRERQAKVQVAIDSAAQRVTKITDSMRDDIQQIIIDGVKDRKPKNKISQELFDKCVGLNRDFQRIADTEIQNNTNSAYIQEEIYNSKNGEKVYFKRFEMNDDNTCKKCKALKGKIVLFSETPLPAEKIKDEFTDTAIWEGKTDGIAYSNPHPYCRGSWIRYYPDLE